MRPDFVHPSGNFLHSAGELRVGNGEFAAFSTTEITTIVDVTRQNDSLDASVLSTGVFSREVAFPMLFRAKVPPLDVTPSLVNLLPKESPAVRNMLAHRRDRGAERGVALKTLIFFEP